MTEDAQKSLGLRLEGEVKAYAAAQFNVNNVKVTHQTIDLVPLTIRRQGGTALLAAAAEKLPSVKGSIYRNLRAHRKGLKHASIITDVAKARFRTELYSDKEFSLAGEQTQRAQILGFSADLNISRTNHHIVTLESDWAYINHSCDDHQLAPFLKRCRQLVKAQESGKWSKLFVVLDSFTGRSEFIFHTGPPISTSATLQLYALGTRPTSREELDSLNPLSTIVLTSGPMQTIRCGARLLLATRQGQNLESTIWFTICPVEIHANRAGDQHVRLATASPLFKELNVSVGRRGVNPELFEELELPGFDAPKDWRTQASSGASDRIPLVGGVLRYHLEAEY